MATNDLIAQLVCFNVQPPEYSVTAAVVDENGRPDWPAIWLMQYILSHYRRAKSGDFYINESYPEHDGMGGLNVPQTHLTLELSDVACHVNLHPEDLQKALVRLCNLHLFGVKRVPVTKPSLWTIWPKMDGLNKIYPPHRCRRGSFRQLIDEDGV